MTLLLGTNLAFADLMQQPAPIIPAGTYDQIKTDNNKPDGQPADKISTLKLPGAGKDQGRALGNEVLPNITKTVIAITGGLALLFLIISGIQLLTAFGNEERVTAAKKTLAYSLIGLLIATLSYAIVQIIVSINISK